ncbi:MAG: hypothetical protein IPK64_02200 [bacterium]|nr:hypothetical protein [bacterium]
MFRAQLAFAAALLFLAATAVIPTPAAADEPVAAASAPVPPTPLMAAIDAVLQAEHAQVAELAAQLATAPDDATALALHRAIELAKGDAQVRVLGVQAEFARREGRLEDAQRIEEAIAAMGRVDVPAAVEARPAPDHTANGR